MVTLSGQKNKRVNYTRGQKMISNDNGVLQAERDKWRSIQARQKEQASTTAGRQALIRLKQLITENESAFFLSIKI